MKRRAFLASLTLAAAGALAGLNGDLGFPRGRSDDPRSWAGVAFGGELDPWQLEVFDLFWPEPPSRVYLPGRASGKTIAREIWRHHLSHLSRQGGSDGE